MKDKPISRLNKERHLANRMPVKATLEQRISRHIEHSKHCTCRPMPENIQKLIEEKDFFAKDSNLYAQFRPNYPKELYDYIYSLMPTAKTVRDCGTGTGQIASIFSKVFPQIIATDINKEQIMHAIKSNNIQYYVSDSANNKILKDNSIDLIVVGSAVHRFKLKSFYKECQRVGKNGTVIALRTYGKTESDNTNLDAFFREKFYNDKYIVGGAELSMNLYKDLPFPFFKEEKQYTIKKKLSMSEFLGYIETTSMAKRFKKVNGIDFSQVYSEEIKGVWGDQDKQIIRRPLILKWGIISK